MNKFSGRARRKIKATIAALEYQNEKFGICEVRNKRIEDLKNSLKEKDTIHVL